MKNVNRLVSKYAPLFLAYLFLYLIVLMSVTGGYFYSQVDELNWNPGFRANSQEKRLEIERLTLRRAFSEVILREFSRSWYCPLVLILATAWIVESLPNRKEKNS